MKDRNKRNFRRVRPHRPKAPVSEYRWAARCYRSARPRPRRLRRQCRGFRRANLDLGPGTAAPPARGRRGGTAVSAARSSASPRRSGRRCVRRSARGVRHPRRWNGVFRRLPRAARATRAGRRVTAPTGLGSATRPGPGEARIGGPGRKIQPGFKPGRASDAPYGAGDAGREAASAKARRSPVLSGRRSRPGADQLGPTPPDSRASPSTNSAVSAGSRRARIESEQRSEHCAIGNRMGMRIRPRR